MNIDVEHIGYNNLLQDFDFMKSIVKIAMNVGWNCYSNNIYLI